MIVGNMEIGKGPIGPQGPEGPIGPMGPRGPIGKPFEFKDFTPEQIELLKGGPVGPMGPIGPMGPEGPTGSMGPQGPMGIDGPIGPSGKDGINGTNGLDFSVMNGNLSEKGHIKFSNGLILQWGTVYNINGSFQSFDFDIPFTSQIFYLNAKALHQASGEYTITLIQPINLTGIKIARAFTEEKTGLTYTCKYFAVGM